MLLQFIQPCSSTEYGATDVGVVTRVLKNVSQKIKDRLGRLKAIRQTTNASHDLEVVEPLANVAKVASLQASYYIDDRTTGLFKCGSPPPKTLKGVLL